MVIGKIPVSNLQSPIPSPQSPTPVTKQGRWHLHLCAALQEILDFPKPPHFPVPCYTATIDHWLNPRTQQVQIFAEAYPAVMRHQAVLNVIFATGDLLQQSAAWQDGLCDRLVLSTYRTTFEQLWEWLETATTQAKPTLYLCGSVIYNRQGLLQLITHF